MIDFHGEFYDVDRCTLVPRSSESGPPIMVGSIGDRMLDITLPHVDAWNMWWSQYGNSVEGFTREGTCRPADRCGRSPTRRGRATAAVLVQLEGGVGRQMGDYDDSETVAPLTGSAEELAAQLRVFESVGARHVQLVVDPITHRSIDWLGDVLTAFRN